VKWRTRNGHPWHCLWNLRCHNCACSK
jgi:hypothetical protein